MQISKAWANVLTDYKTTVLGIAEGIATQLLANGYNGGKWSWPGFVLACLMALKGLASKDADKSNSPNPTAVAAKVPPPVSDPA